MDEIKYKSSSLLRNHKSTLMSGGKFLAFYSLPSHLLAGGTRTAGSWLTYIWRQASPALDEPGRCLPTTQAVPACLLAKRSKGNKNILSWPGASQVSAGRESPRCYTIGDFRGMHIQQRGITFNKFDLIYINRRCQSHHLLPTCTTWRTLCAP